MKRDHKKIIVTFLLPLLFLYAVFQLYPLLLNLFYSMLNWNGITKTANFVGLDNYVEVLGDFSGGWWMKFDAVSSSCARGRQVWPLPALWRRVRRRAASSRWAQSPSMW